MYKGNVKEINLHNLGVILKPIFLTLIPTHSNDNRCLLPLIKNTVSQYFQPKFPILDTD